MWAFFSRRLRRWLLFVVGLPILGWVLRSVSDAVESRRGEQSRLASGLRSASDLVDRRKGRRRRRGLF